MRHVPDELVQDLLERLEAASVRYAEAKAERIGLEELRKVTKAELMAVAEAEDVRTITKQERFAYSHPTYGQIVKKLKAAIKREIVEEYACKLVEMEWETWRTVNANQRAARVG